MASWSTGSRNCMARGICWQLKEEDQERDGVFEAQHSVDFAWWDVYWKDHPGWNLTRDCGKEYTITQEDIEMQDEVKTV